MRRLLLAIALPGLFGCEQRVASDPPPVVPASADPAPTSSALEALLFGPKGDAGPALVEMSRTMTVTLCSSSPEPCGASDPDASVDAGYRVRLGSGRAAIRSRGQAMTDLYEELRNRTALGQRFDAEAHAAGGPAPPTVQVARPATKPSTGSADPLTQCAFRLLDLVDSAGEVTIDRVHGNGSTGCLVSLGGASQCLVEEPERPHQPSRGGLPF